MEIRAGSRLKSAVCNTEVIAVKAPGEDMDIRCGGVPMLDPSDTGEEGGKPDAAAADGTQMGKRYVDSNETIELLCTKPGDGSLGIGDALLAIKESKPLPASD
ncbi:MAG: hypothetical protein QF596_02510 [Acidimicrobiales bacterium]|nr:hypothetical protein [Acidimicrobiales bacterium]MDP6297883.1 hypothetical protein [Acidimicrobiales bacterium]HJM28509.1 hypothetical protein [Acidimicrobiales bacterium]HJM98320.1 hypothetical protein [Acidimicrobiales bacterium]